MSKRKRENLFVRESNCSEQESFYEAYTNSNSSDEEEIRFPRNRNVNRIASSDSDSDIDKCNGSDTECNEDSIDEILQELIIDEDRRTDDTEENTIQFGEWNEFSGRQKSFSFSETGGLIRQLPGDVHPYDVFALFVDDEIIDLMVSETNRYAEQKLNKSDLPPCSRMHKWKPTNPEEIKKFLGLILYMGVVKVNPIANYWSKSPLYNFQLPRTIMSRNRFELLLSNFHFANNESIARNDRLGKIRPLFDKLEEKYQEILTPGEHIVIDETLIPWRGRLIFRQYIPNKAHKYGIKLFKLCSDTGYTWAMKIYSGKSADGIRETGLAHNVCLELAEKLFHQGRTLYIDNFYTSYELAISCLNRKTHVVGTLRNNKKFLPKDILHCKLRKGEMVSKEDDNGIVVLKWRDTRDVRILSTKHAPIMVPIAKKNRSIRTISPSEQIPATLKPLAVVEYNTGKCGIDYSDQMVSYATTIRKGIKWYRKLGIQLLLGISVVNALTVYKIATKKDVNIRRFREILASKLFGLSDSTTSPCSRRRQHHIAVRKNDSGGSIRRACKQCYANKSCQMGRSRTRDNVNKTTTYCPSCPNQPQLCIECFKAWHSP
ncbi:PREDICTED: piggyBac transposable element-derived protein 4-like [Dufourea novaeangliae]|uniref:piggyBac transposable element-derived protein 4-like n=1 Tax=Dufourea novaeangliae TaxID=178035 RepID=UPI00076709A4|nr:PREDICTED: piggyBac transposable element-derived protein 4-like [Dufourea novaeangliae]XP_015437622.1 PREDICTED: piggyBac transposable element-derived protein 4-like [Dufourea novaeangliae]